PRRNPNRSLETNEELVNEVDARVRQNVHLVFEMIHSSIAAVLQEQLQRQNMQNPSDER
ncbi:hypothetical protein BaRGS_00038630, partial [Batillaria attramentaria]